jgi:hypothetical protein
MTRYNPMYNYVNKNNPMIIIKQIYVLPAYLIVVNSFLADDKISPGIHNTSPESPHRRMNYIIV